MTTAASKHGISATIIADSISPALKRLTSVQVTVHRYVLAEVNTHRVFSRSWRSSRAVPVKTLLKEVRNNPAMPVRWEANQPGMQGGSLLEGSSLIACQQEWRAAARDAAHRGEKLMESGLHKSWANRVLEPYLFVHGIITSTEWDNFFDLRLHKDAQPEMQILAKEIHKAMAKSKPVPLEGHQWHLPYVTEKEASGRLSNEVLRQLSTARCARVSYKLHDGSTPDVDSDLRLYEKLMGSKPWHASPSEHQARPEWAKPGDPWAARELHGNLVGWKQNRKYLEEGFADE